MSYQVLDGAAGTYLEQIGVKLHPKLWSSGELLTDEGCENIRKLHRAYIESNVDIITSVTYQASIEGFSNEGKSFDESFDLITRGVKIAKEEAAKKNVKVAAGLGPYGAYLSNGEEYTGQYKANKDTLAKFWLPRIKAALAGSPDYLLFETIPNFDEVKFLVTEGAALSPVPVWVSLSLNTEKLTLADGTPLTQVASVIKDSKIELVGANCFDITKINEVINALQVIGKPLLVYPNSGEVYDGKLKTWSGVSSNDWQPTTWASNNVRVIGGCCRTTPEIISRLK